MRVAPNEAHEQRVLVFSPTGRDGTVVSALLRRAGIQTSLCDSLGALLAGLEEGADAAFVAEEGLFGQDLNRLADWIKHQPPWSDLPFVMLTSRHDHPKVRAWRQAQVGWLGNVSLIERPVQPITLVSVLQAALRARKRQWEIRALLEAREAAATDLESRIEQRTAQLRDVNARLRGEIQERARVEETLRRAQKLEAMGRLTGGVAHDFNNLLMVISAGLDMLERRDDPERRAKLMRGMRQAAQRGSSLTRQLLAFSRSHALRPETVELPKLIGDMKELLDRSLRGDIEVKLELAPNLWAVFVDPGELELVILNLAVNARDAIEGSGVVTISGENIEPEGREGEGKFVRLCVRDTGSGMSEDVKARVFEPFFTTKDVGKGSGLGLAQVYGFAKQSGGSVTIDSAIGQGATITLTLPRSDSDPDKGPERVVETPARASKPAECVLLVEDDSEVASLVEEMLRCIGYDVIHAASASAALGALANSRRVDLVFSDIMMPGGMSGIALAKEIRNRRPRLPVLLTSGFSEIARSEAEALGISILRKPYGIEELRMAVSEQLPRSG